MVPRARRTEPPDSRLAGASTIVAHRSTAPSRTKASANPVTSSSRANPWTLAAVANASRASSGRSPNASTPDRSTPDVGGMVGGRESRFGVAGATGGSARGRAAPAVGGGGGAARAGGAAARAMGGALVTTSSASKVDGVADGKGGGTSGGRGSGRRAEAGTLAWPDPSDQGSSIPAWASAAVRTRAAVRNDDDEREGEGVTGASNVGGERAGMAGAPGATATTGVVVGGS